MTSLADRSVASLREALASVQAEAGGGTAVLVGAALGASLLAMAAAVTNRRSSSARVEALGTRADRGADRLLDLAEADGRAYARVLEARRLPRETPEQQDVRQRCLEEALLEALRVPLEAATLCRGLLEVAEESLDCCRPVTHSDVGSGALLLAAGVRGSLYNLRQNSAGRPDSGAWLQQGKALQDTTDELLSRILRRVEEGL